MSKIFKVSDSYGGEMYIAGADDLEDAKSKYHGIVGRFCELKVKFEEVVSLPDEYQKVLP